MSVEAEDYAYSYQHQSTVDATDVGVDLRLATSGGTSSTGVASHPYFFEGFVEHAEPFAAALLVVARVARTRFYTPPGMLAAILRVADPIVTSNGDRLRFESFSACCGVYCRLDALPGGLDRPPRDTGTTNVDFNAPMRVRLRVLVDSTRCTSPWATMRCASPHSTHRPLSVGCHCRGDGSRAWPKCRLRRLD